MTAGDLFETLTERLTGSKPVEDMYSAIGIVSDNVAALPSSMIGTVEPPFVLDDIQGGTNLEPFPRGLRSQYIGRTGPPDYHEIVGNTLVVYPTPDQAYTVTFEASMFPVKPTIATHLLPFNGLFDFIFREIVIMVMLQGGAAVIQADAFLTKTLDGIDRNRSTRKVRYRYFA